MITVEPFAGCGGMALGLRLAGFECVHASDADRDAIATLRQIVPDAEVLRLEMGNACLPILAEVVGRAIIEVLR